MRHSVELALALLVSAQAHAQCHEGVVQGASIRWRSVLPEGSALVLQPEAIDWVSPTGSRQQIVVAHQRFESPSALRPPLVHGVQRIALASDEWEHVAFQPALGSSIQAHVGYHASVGITDAQRAELDAVCGPAPPRSVCIYVDAERGTDLRGEITSAADRQRFFLWAGLAIGALVLAAAALALRHLRRRALEEQADAVIDERFRELEQRAPR